MRSNSPWSSRGPGFFFKAEEGIRDADVTGVQTCALPIYRPMAMACLAERVFVREEIHHVREGKHGACSAKQAIAIGLSKARRANVPLPPPPKGKTSRSEERRVGKECRSRWSPYH